jgi:hypothetical protein
MKRLRAKFHPERPRRLARPRTSPFHGGNTGSNPVGDAKRTGSAFFAVTFFERRIERADRF